MGKDKEIIIDASFKSKVPRKDYESLQKMLGNEDLVLRMISNMVFDQLVKGNSGITEIIYVTARRGIDLNDF